MNINSLADSNKKPLLDTDIKGVTLMGSKDINISNVKKHGFNTVFLTVDNIRSSKQPYNTNYKALKQLISNISLLEKANLDYVLCFSSGPGYSSDGKTSTIFKNKMEINYFSKMVKEIVKRFQNHPNFKAASINLLASDNAEDKYYSAENLIINNVRVTFNDLPFVYNLHPFSFEEGYKNAPDIKLPNIVINMTLGLKGLTYPGYGAAYKASCTLNKNALLSNLEKLKEYDSDGKYKTIITLKTPWVKNSEVLLQDLFEIYKMLKFDFSLSYGNSLDNYDFTNNTDTLRVLDRHNR